MKALEKKLNTYFSLVLIGPVSNFALRQQVYLTYASWRGFPLRLTNFLKIFFAIANKIVLKVLLVIALIRNLWIPRRPNILLTSKIEPHFFHVSFLCYRTDAFAPHFLRTELDWHLLPRWPLNIQIRSMLKCTF